MAEPQPTRGPVLPVEAKALEAGPGYSIRDFQSWVVNQYS